MTTLVVDASVAAKWFLPAGEPLREEALALLEAYAGGDIRFLVPDLFWAEIANIAWKAARQRRLSRGDAAAAVAALLERAFPTTAAAALLSDALAIALAYDRTVYDSLYVALAVATRGVLVTADERLADALAARLPVQWLGAYRWG